VISQGSQTWPIGCSVCQENDEVNWRLSCI